MAAEPNGAIKFLGHVAYEFATVKPLLPTYLHLLLSAIFPIYTAAHASLARPPSASPPDPQSEDESSTGKIDEEVVHKLESLTPSDAITFPILAALTLSSLYYLLKWLQDPAFLNRCLSIYFSGAGLFFATEFLRDSLTLIRSFIFPHQYSAHGLVWKASPERDFYRAFLSAKKPAVFTEKSPLPGWLRRFPIPQPLKTFLWKLRRLVYAEVIVKLHVRKFLDLKLSVSFIDVISVTLASLIVAYDLFVKKLWFITNFLGFSFCYGTLQIMTPTTGWTGTLILIALFFYDIYFVFYTPMMVTVATKLEVPIKLLFPRPHGCLIPEWAEQDAAILEGYRDCLAKDRAMAMLGLGDIVIPGMVLAFALRFDLYLHYLRKLRRLSSSENTASTEDTRPRYSRVTGGWGERFWTNGSLQDPGLLAKRFSKTYFKASIVGYLVGMIATLVGMQIMDHAQPALLYLVPGVLTSLWGLALLKGDLKLLWYYTEAMEATTEEKQKGRSKEATDDPKSPQVTYEDKRRIRSDSVNEIILTNGNAKTREPENSEQQLPSENPSFKKSSKEKIDNSNDNIENRDRHLVFFSISWPEKKKSKTSGSATTPEKTESGEALESEKVSDSTQESKLRAREVTSAEDSDANHIDILPDVKAEQAVLPKDGKEATASSADVTDGKGGEPPEKRRRKG